MGAQRYLNYKLFFYIYFSMTCFLFLTSCAIGQKGLNEKLSIENHVNECIKIIPDGLSKKNDSLYLKTIWEHEKVTGYCGCKSALLTYEVVSKKSTGEESYRKHFSSLNHDSFDFLVGRASEKYDFFSIEIYCKNPD